MIKAIDFFCGAGGLSRGLLNSGIKVLAGVDNDEALRMTYEKNNSPSQFICQDIKLTNIFNLRRQLGIQKADTVLYAACTPCQPFSTLNQMKGNDERRDLLLSFALLVEQSPPDYILVENVPGLNTSYGREIYDSFMKTIGRAGFTDVFSSQLDAKDYGVPQVRKRFILLASRHGTIIRPKRVLKQATVRMFIEKYPPIEDGASSPVFLNHTSRRLAPQHRPIVLAVPHDGGSRRDVKDTSILLPCHQRNPGAHKDVFGRMRWDAPAPTLTCRCTDIYCGRFTHPDQNRGISLREAAALQTFPDSYEFHGEFIHVARQIGNAVPVKLAQTLGNSIRRTARIYKGKKFFDQRHNGMKRLTKNSSRNSSRLRVNIQTRNWLQQRRRSVGELNGRQSHSGATI